MFLKLISCDVFQREACLCLAQSPHVIDPEFIQLGQHSRSDKLRQLLQRRIDASGAGGRVYDAVLLLFGICGNATIGLTAGKSPLVMPRAHDCCTVLLGSRRRFAELFKLAPSTPFSSVGYLERGEYFMPTGDDARPAVVAGDPFMQLVEKFGPADARYIWEQMHPPGSANEKAVYIELPETAHLGHRQQFQAKAGQAGKQVEILTGDLRLIRALIFAQWDPSEFLIVKPGQRIAGVYDWDRIVKAKKSP